MKKSIKNVLLTTAGAASVLAGVQLSANASTVKSIKGDTVWAFAQKNHTTVDAIVQANHLTNANLIFVDQELTIPDATDQANQTSQASQTATSDASATSATSQAASVNSADANGDYTVAAGDTLNAIASKTGKSVSDLASLNGISNINVLMVGQVLHITGTASQATSVASQASQASQAPVSQASQATSVVLSQASQASQAPASQATSVAPSQASASQATSVAPSQAPASQAASVAPSQAPQASQAPVAVSAAPKQTASVAYAGGAAAGIAGFYSGVDGYPARQCTSFVAGILQAEGIPSSEWAYLGNGNAWGANAAVRPGVAVNQTPTAGSVAFFGYMHVAYVTGVNGNGTVNIIEGNFNGGHAYNARTIPVSEAAGYIHF